jgi:hypothetical protein
MAERVAQTKELIDALLREPNVQEAVQEILPMVDESFLHVLNSELAQARQKGDLERSGKLQQILTVLESASAPPPEVAQIEELLDLENDQDRRAWLESHRDQVTPALLETLTALMAQTQDSAEAELSQRLQAVYRAVLRFSMEKNI